MEPVKAHPDNYNLDAFLDLSKNMRALLGLNLIGLVLFFLFGWVFWRLFAWVRPDFSLRSLGAGPFAGVVLFLFASVLVIIFHEIIHGVFFWIFLRSRPSFRVSRRVCFCRRAGLVHPPPSVCHHWYGAIACHLGHRADRVADYPNQSSPSFLVRLDH